MTEKLKPEEAVLATLSSLPYELIHAVVVASLPFKDPIVGKIMKLTSLSLQEKLIKVIFLFFSSPVPYHFVITVFS